MAVRAVLKQPEKNAQRDPGENGWACYYCGKEGHSPTPFLMSMLEAVSISFHFNKTLLYKRS